MSRVDRPLNVLWVTPYIPALGTHAGAGRIYNFLTRLACRHKINLLSFIESEEDLAHLPRLEEACQKVELVWRRCDFGAPNPLKRLPPSVAYEFCLPEMQSKFREMTANGGYDLIQFEYLNMAWFAPQAAQCPTLLTHHEVQFPILWQRFSSLPVSDPRKYWTFYRWLQMLDFELTVLGRFSRVVALTDVDADALRSYRPELPLSVINTGVDCENFSPLDDCEEEGAILFVGYYKHEPNVEAARFFVEEAYPRLRAIKPECKLYLVGNSPSEEILNLAEPGKIVVTGHVPDLKPYYSRAQVFVVPIRSGMGIRGKILEAWAMGKAVVSTNLGASGLRAKHGDNILLADDPEDFAREVARLLDSPELRCQLGAEGRSTAVKHYDASSMVEGYEELYLSLTEAWKKGRVR